MYNFIKKPKHGFYRQQVVLVLLGLGIHVFIIICIVKILYALNLIKGV